MIGTARGAVRNASHSQRQAISRTPQRGVPTIRLLAFRRMAHFPRVQTRRGGRVVDGSGLENRQGASPRGFESHPLRCLPHRQAKIPKGGSTAIYVHVNLSGGRAEKEEEVCSDRRGS